MIYEELIEMYSLQGRYEDSLQVYEKAFKNILNDDGLALAHETLARVHMQKGKYDLALAELKMALSMRPDPFIQADMVRCEADILFFKDNLDEALIKYQQLNNIEAAQWTQPWRFVVNIYVSQGRMDEAIDFLNNRLQSLLELEESSQDKKIIRILLEKLAWLQIKTGEPELALGNLKKALSLIDEDSPAQSFRKFNLFFQALAYIEMNRLEEARKTIEENKRVWPPIVKKSFLGDIEADIHFLIGKMALKNENFKEAITVLEKAVSLLPGEVFDIDEWWYGLHALYMDSLASAYSRNDNLDLAIATYEKIHNLTYGRLIWGDIYARSFFMLGKIYEQKDWKGKAIESYEKFLTLWKDADPIHLKVADASKRLDELKN
jgi:tetratricopeptide (TPR) repeat protein